MKKQYRIGESIQFYKQRIEADTAVLNGLTELVQTGHSPDEFITQDWRSSIQRELDLRKLRATIREELRAEMSKKPETA